MTIRKDNRQRAGFTLMEMLIVVAIIAILVALMIPTFAGALEKARETTDIANIRSAYATISVDSLVTGELTSRIVIDLKQTQDDWQSDDLNGVLETLGTVEGSPTKGGACEISWIEETGTVLFKFEGSLIRFPSKDDRQGFSQAYADLVDKYFRSGVLDAPDGNNRAKPDDWYKPYNGHMIVNIANTDGKFNQKILKQAEKDGYDSAVLQEINNSQSRKIYTAYFDENHTLIGFSYTQEEYTGKITPQTFCYLRDGNGNLVLRDAPNAIGDDVAKKALADHYWPVSADPTAD